MAWQDIVFTLGNIGLSLGLFAAIRDKATMPIKTCAIGIVCMVGIAYANFSLHYPVSTVACGASALGWAILFFQNLRHLPVTTKDDGDVWQDLATFGAETFRNL